MLNALIDYLNNDFRTVVKVDDYKITGGGITLDFIKPGQYFRIVGSIFNDGVYKYPCAGLTDETFNGAVIGMAIPNEVIKIAADVSAWVAKDNESGDYTAESFGGYSYTKATGANGKRLTWIDKFGSSLRRWRKL